MNEPDSLESALLFEMSRRNTDMIVGLLSQKPELLGELFKIFLSSKDPANRRAGWAIDIYTERNPVLLTQYLPGMLNELGKFKHDGLKRHALRMIARSPLPDDDHLGRLISICFDWLLSPVEAVAAKIHCMDILYRISQNEPDLQQELADSIEWRMPEESPGFKNKGKKMLSKLYREIELLGAK